MEKTRVNSVRAFFTARDTGEFAPNPKWQVTQVLSNQEPTQEHRLSPLLHANAVSFWRIFKCRATSIYVNWKYAGTERNGTEWTERGNHLNSIVAMEIRVCKSEE